MAEQVDYQFHAERLLENPAWKKSLVDLRKDMDERRDALGYHDRDERWAVTVAETVLTQLEEAISRMAQSNAAVRLYHERQARAIP